jgi:hypothetical protein
LKIFNILRIVEECFVKANFFIGINYWAILGLGVPVCFCGRGNVRWRYAKLYDKMYQGLRGHDTLANDYTLVTQNVGDGAAILQRTFERHIDDFYSSPMLHGLSRISGVGALLLL